MSEFLKTKIKYRYIGELLSKEKTKLLQNKYKFYRYPEKKEYKKCLNFRNTGLENAVKLNKLRTCKMLSEF